MSLSIGATGMILSFRDLGKQFHAPAKNRLNTVVFGANPFKNFVLQEVIYQKGILVFIPSKTSRNPRKIRHRSSFRSISKHNDLRILDFGLKN